MEVKNDPQSVFFAGLNCFFYPAVTIFDNNDMGESTKLMMEAQLRDNPLRVMVSFSDGRFSMEDIEEICRRINEDNK